MAKKLTVNMVAMGNLKHRKKHYIGLTAGILLAMVFICGISFFDSCIETSRVERRFRNVGKQTEIVLNAQDVDWEKVQNNCSLVEKPGFIHVTSYIWSGDPEKGTSVGWLDQQAQNLYYLQIQEGRMPENANEIAVEESLLRRLAPNTKLGETFEVSVGNAESPASQTYQLVGILRNRKIYLEKGWGNLQDYPDAFIKEPEVPSAEEKLVALLNTYKGEQVPGKKSIYDYCDAANVIVTYINYFGDGNMHNGESTLTLSSNLSWMLAALSCFGIAGAFYSDLMQRRQQIGMLRAVGATRRQIIILYGREAFLLALSSVPVGVAAAYFTVWLFAHCLEMVFLPDFGILIRSGIISFIAVIVSALLPLFAASACTPMQAIRNTGLMRQMKRKKIHSRKMFFPSMLLSRRRLLFYGAQRKLMILVLALSTGIFSVYTVRSVFRMEYLQEREPFDYTVKVKSYRPFEEIGYINEWKINSLISESQRLECLDDPNVAKIDGEIFGLTNLLLDGEMPKYLDLWGTAAWGIDSKYGLLRLDRNWKGSKEAFWQEAHKEINSNYLYAKEIGGYDQEIFNTRIYGYSLDLLKQLSPNVIEGEIHPDKLRSGEEVLLCAPKKIGFTHYPVSENTWQAGIVDLNEGVSNSFSLANKKDRQNIIDTADSPFSVGDTLNLSVLCDNGEGFIRRTDKKVTIGAIIDCYGQSNMMNDPVLFTTPEILNQMGEFEYNALYITLNSECTEAMDLEMQKTLETIFPGQNITSAFEIRQYAKVQFRNEIISLVTLFAVFIAASAGIISNHMSARIREGKRTIGTLRAVGADHKILVKSYLNEIFILCIEGGCLGVAGFWIFQGIGILRGRGYALGFNCLPALVLMIAVLICCSVHLWIQVRKVSKQSIVENIRELG